MTTTTTKIVQDLRSKTYGNGDVPDKSSDYPPDKSGTNIDRGYAWVVLAAVFIAMVIINGFFCNVGIYYMKFLEDFGESRAATSWIVAAQGICVCLAGPVSSVLLPRFGARMTMVLGACLSSVAVASMYKADSILYLIVAFGISGMGTSLVLTSSIAAVALYFNEHLYVASGVVNSGVGVGIMLIGVETEWVISQFGWRGSMLIQSGLILQIVLCGALVFRVPAKDGETGRSADAPRRNGAPASSSSGSIFRDVRFCLLLTGLFFYYGLLTVLMGLLKDIARSKGLDSAYALIITCLGVSNTAGRLASGLLSNYVRPPLLYFAASASCAAAIAGLVLTTTEWVFVACVSVFAFSVGQQAVLQNLTFSFMFSRDLMAVLFGYSLFMGAISIVTISPLVGYMADVSGKYDSALWLASSGFFTCGFLFLVSYLLHQRKIASERVNDETNEDETKPLSAGLKR